MGLAGHRFRQEGLASARGAYKQGALGYLAAQLGILLRMAQELHDLLQLLLGGVKAGLVF